MPKHEINPLLAPETLHTTREGCVFDVLHYNSYSQIIVRCGHYVTVVRGGDLLRGQIKNPYHKSVYGVGYLGEGPNKPSLKGKHCKSYILWKGMIERCYSGNYDTYNDCKVCDKWHCYQSFCEDLPLIEGFKEDLYGLELDKDLKSKDNKCYSLDTCCFISKSDNVIERNKRCSNK